MLHVAHGVFLLKICLRGLPTFAYRARRPFRFVVGFLSRGVGTSATRTRCPLRGPLGLQLTFCSLSNAAGTSQSTGHCVLGKALQSEGLRAEASVRVIMGMARLLTVPCARPVSPRPWPHSAFTQVSIGVGVRGRSET